MLPELHHKKAKKAKKATPKKQKKAMYQQLRERVFSFV